MYEQDPGSRRSNETRPETEALQAYHDALDEASMAHVDRHGAIRSQHNERATNFVNADHFAARELDDALSETTVDLSIGLQRSRIAITTVFDQHHTELINSLDHMGAWCWETIIKYLDWDANTADPLIQDILLEANDNETADTLHAALDSFTWKNIEYAMEQGAAAHDENVVALLNNASSSQARTAMRAALDSYVYTDTLGTLHDYNPRHTNIYRYLHHASSPEAQEAMRSGIDSSIWRNINRMIDDGYALENSDVQQLLMKSSSLSIARLIKRTLTYEPQQNSYQENREQPQAQPKESFTPPQPSALTIKAQQIVHTVTEQYRGVSWLKTADVNDIKRVIKSVEALRQQAAENGEPISDRQIYLRYRKKVDAEASDQLNTSFRILNAFMNGDPKSKLPF